MTNEVFLTFLADIQLTSKLQELAMLLAVAVQ